MRSVTLTGWMVTDVNLRCFLIRWSVLICVSCSAWRPSRSVTVCLSPVGVSKAVENINKIIAPALVSKVGHFVVW